MQVEHKMLIPEKNRLKCDYIGTSSGKVLMHGRSGLRYLAVILALCWSVSFLAFMHAEIDFSYDHHHYMDSLSSLEGLTLQDMVTSMKAFFPYPYVQIPPASLYEVGFVGPAWILMQIFGDAKLVYALIAATSIAVRTWAMMRMKIGMGWIFFINVFAITLFDANAIRVGCGLTVLLIGMSVLRNGGSQRLAVGLMLSSVIFHLQLLLFSFFFVTLYFFGRYYLRSKLRTYTIALLLVACSYVIALALELHGPTKIEDYAIPNKGVGGINSVSILGVLAICYSLGVFFSAAKKQSRKDFVAVDSRMWIAGVLAAIPSLTMHLVTYEMAIVGGRLWQLALICMICLAVAVENEDRKRRWLTASIFGALLLAVNINILFRYQMSNFFYPIIPYYEVPLGTN